MTFGPPARFMEMIHSYNARRVVSHVVALFAIFLLALGFTTAAHPQSARTSKKFQNYLVPRRSIQIHDGFGINSDLPRDPYVPWNRWWWTRIFDAGISFIRIGQYENSSDPTSWDWVERKRGEYSIAQEVDDQIDSLVENGVHIEIQLLYGNPLYTSPAGRAPQTVTPAPGGFHNPDRSLYSVFWPPKTPEQIQAFSNYARWMANHFRGRAQYYEIWNEPNIDYWNPAPSPEEYGRLFKAVAPAIRAADPSAKIIFGGLAGADRKFAKRALDACACGEGIDVFAYHIYPDYGQNLNPEAMDDERHTSESPKALRDMVRNYPGIRKDLVVWNDEFNSIPSWQGSDESVQTKYLPRGLFSDTKFDPAIEVHSEGATTSPALLGYGFRSPKNRAIIAYWLPVLSKAGDRSAAANVNLRISDSGIEHPVLVDVTAGERTPLSWKPGTTDTLERMPLFDGLMAIADESYFDWTELPEAASELTLAKEPEGLRLAWKMHAGNPESVSVERRIGEHGQWRSVAILPAAETSFLDEQVSHDKRPVSYRVLAENAAGHSAYSNVATLRE